MATFPLVLEKHVHIRGTLTLLTGLHVGGNKENLEVGGTDNAVIRDPVTKEPYIPGSSLKGKLRSLLEWRHGKMGERGLPCGCAQPGCPVCTLFGPHSKPVHGLGPSRLLVRDAFLVPGSQGLLSRLQDEGLPMAEIKTEVTIDRRTGVALHRGLRTQERVPKGAQFQLEMTLRVFKGDDEQKLVGWVEDGLKLLGSEAIGGSGSRGYGWVEVDYSVQDRA
jgi:CRISPR-associated protein Csm3